jgi:hypothetical protein
MAQVAMLISLRNAAVAFVNQARSASIVTPDENDKYGGRGRSAGGVKAGLVSGLGVKKARKRFAPDHDVRRN